MALCPRTTASSLDPLFKKKPAQEKRPWISTSFYFTFKNPASARHEVSISEFWITLSFLFESSFPAPRRGEELYKIRFLNGCIWLWWVNAIAFWWWNIFSDL